MCLSQSLTLTDLYGKFDDVALDWTDGVLSKLFRACIAAAQPSGEAQVDSSVSDDDSGADTSDHSPIRKPSVPQTSTSDDDLLGDADTPKLRWIVFDGPVATSWIENLNTVRLSVWIMMSCLCAYHACALLFSNRSCLTIPRSFPLQVGSCCRSRRRCLCCLRRWTSPVRALRQVRRPFWPRWAPFHIHC